MKFEPNNLCYHMMWLYSQHKKPDNKITIFNEGGTRSSKTWDTFHLLLAICDHNRGRGLDIYVLRDTLTNCKDYTLKDFNGVLTACGLQNEILIKHPEKPYFNVWGNNMYFRGLDDEENVEGYPSDILFFNEILETRKSKVDGLMMRCRMLLIGDWNPKLTKHWVFRLEGQPDTFFTHTTYKNNKYLQQSIIRGIEAYEPTPENIAAGTADEYRWKVYGLGLRACNEATVFKEWDTYTEEPKEYELRVYGMDFGFTNDPTTLVELKINGKDLYVREYLYQTGLINSEIFNIVNKIVDKNSYIVADSAEPKSIAELRRYGLPVIEATKGADSIKFGINKILQYRLHIAKNSLNLQNEIRNYKYQTDRDNNVLNIPYDMDNHLIDPLRYALTKFKR